MHTVYLGLGSNLENPMTQLKDAIERLNAHNGIEKLRSSSFYGSKPLGPQDQPDFVNAVVEIVTTLTPQALLKVTQQIEMAQGRIKKRHWGERLIDIDILVYGALVVAEPNLKIPHTEIAQRDFVLLPLQELAPELQIPNMPSLSQMIANLEQTFVFPLNV